MRWIKHYMLTPVSIQSPAQLWSLLISKALSISYSGRPSLLPLTSSRCSKQVTHQARIRRSGLHVHNRFSILMRLKMHTTFWETHELFYHHRSPENKIGTSHSGRLSFLWRVIWNWLASTSHIAIGINEDQFLYFYTGFPERARLILPTSVRILKI